MADILIAAAAEQAREAGGLNEALSSLGFAVALAPAAPELGKTVDDAKCVLALWAAEDSAPPWLAALAALALERKKLVSVELAADAAPAPFRAGPRVDLSAGDRAGFKTGFETLVGEVQKLSATLGDAEALLEAVGKARAALMPPPPPPPASEVKIVREPPRRRSLWPLAGLSLLAVATLFAVGFGVGRALYVARHGGQFLPEVPLRLPSLPASAPAPEAAPAQAQAPEPEGVKFGLTLSDLESLSWRDAAARLNAENAAAIKAAAARGDPLAQTLACLGHMAGAPGFLPSPTTAREQCDAASRQDYPAALQLSWQLRRSSPRATISEAEALTRLQRAAAEGWLPALVDYGQALAGDFRTSTANQTEAGRLLLAAAERNDPRGQYLYARWLRDSSAGPRDPAAAIPYLQRAADHGLAEAQHLLATLYRDGIGAPKDRARALALYQSAAAQNYPPAMFNLADMLDSGDAEERARAAALYQTLSCMRDERQIQPMAAQKLRALGRPQGACG